MRSAANVSQQVRRFRVEAERRLPKDLAAWFRTIPVDMKKIFDTYYRTKEAEQSINQAKEEARQQLDEKMAGYKKEVEATQKLAKEAENEAWQLCHARRPGGDCWSRGDRGPGGHRRAEWRERKNVPPGQVWFGAPAVPIQEAKERIAQVARLSKLIKRVKRLESSPERVED